MGAGNPVDGLLIPLRIACQPSELGSACTRTGFLYATVASLTLCRQLAYPAPAQ